MKLAERTFRRNDYGISSRYGTRKDPFTGKETWHSGVDYTTKLQKWAQYALEDGYVLAAGADNSAMGQGALFAWVVYPRLGYECLYYHLDRVFVSRNQKVNANTVIGNTGTTGRSTGIHLHFEIRNSHTKVKFDPESINYIPPEIIVNHNPNANPNLRVTGVWCSDTTRALQKYLGTLQDGVIAGQMRQRASMNIKSIRFGTGGSMMVREMQRRLGITGAGLGQLGAKTISALQKHLGYRQAGYISPVSDTVKIMQKQLRDGTFNL